MGREPRDDRGPDDREGPGTTERNSLTTPTNPDRGPPPGGGSGVPETGGPDSTDGE